MKAIKISLVVIVVALIVFFVFQWWVPTTEIKKNATTGNPYIDEIQQKIDLISQLPDNKFCKDAYDNIIYEINQAEMPQLPQHPFGRLGKTQLENEQQKEILITNLYSVYSQKFINQAFYVFQNLNCNVANLNFIKTENRLLKSSKLLETGSYIYNQLSKVDGVLNVYDEALIMINSCKGYNPPIPNGSGSDGFPITDITQKLTQAKALLQNLIRNSSEFKCTQLQIDLKEVPQWLFNVHVVYLEKKVELFRDEYKNYNTYDHYGDSVGTPMYQEIEILNSSIYIDVIDKSAYKKLKDIWEIEYRNAYNWTYNTSTGLSPNRKHFTKSI